MPNNFAGDPNCKALWRFESGALTTDSKGTNTLTNNGVTANTTTYKEGAASGSFVSASNQYESITDANLQSGFPLKSGETNKTFSICVWIYITSWANRAIYSKAGSANQSFGVWLNSSGQIYNNIWNPTGSADGTTHASVLSTSNWYHLTAAYDNSNYNYTIRIKDSNGNTVGTDISATATNAQANGGIKITTNPVIIGEDGWTGSQWNGLMDEMVVFSDIITADEATQIAQGIYGISTKLERGIKGLERGLYGGL